MFIIHTNDHNPPHVTVYLGTPKNHEAICRINIENLQIMSGHKGFKSSDLESIRMVCLEYQEIFMEVWNETRPK